MRHPNRIALALTACFLSATFAATAANVATVNGVAIPDSKVDFFLKQVAERGQKDSPELRARIKEELIRNEVLFQEAQKKGVEKHPEVQQRLDMAKQQILVGAYVNDFAKANPISDAELKKEFDKIKVNFSGKEYKARHILVKSEDEAKAILADLKKGKKFDDIAKAKSTDKGSAINGGDLGWSTPANYVKEFGEALAKLPKGKISDPVKTQFGWHIIKLDDQREAKGPSFEEVKPELQRELQGQRVQKMVEDLRAKAKV
jgi:peptidyl-prolyl cis-trans isomerase C